MENSNQYQLELRDIRKEYPGVLALNNVTMNVVKGEVHGLVGENGAGKSTLIKVLAGAHAPNAGEIVFEGKSYKSLTPREAMDIGIACIYQELNQVPYMTVTENIFLGREIRKENRFLNLAEQRRQTVEVLKEFNLDIDPDMQLGLLGVGRRQLVEILKAVHAEARIIIMDEPTASLSEKEAGELFKIVEELRKKEVTIIFISHRLDEVKAICDALTVLRDGEVVANRRIDEVTVDDIVRLMVGRDITNKYPKIETKKGEVLLEVKGLTHHEVYKDVSFKVHAGEILGVSGLVGSGRTETIRGLTGADPIDGGEVFIHGKKVAIKNPVDSIRNGIAFLTEDRKGQGLVLLQTVEFNTNLVVLNKYKKFKALIDLAKMRDKALQMVDNLQIKVPGILALAGHLSGGNQQKVVLAKWLLSEADIFIFDEPTRGIDVGAKIEVYNLINDLVANGKAVIMISSEMDECMGMADRIIVFHEGSVMGELDREHFSDEKIMYAASGYPI